MTNRILDINTFVVWIAVGGKEVETLHFIHNNTTIMNKIITVLKKYYCTKFSALIQCCTTLMEKVHIHNDGAWTIMQDIAV